MGEFVPVEVIKSFLGIKKGTILKFDSASGKYVSLSREEEIGDNEYYYSGHAIAIDPTIVKANVDKIFKLIPKVEKPTVPVEIPKIEKDEKSESIEDQKTEENVCKHCENCTCESNEESKDAVAQTEVKESTTEHKPKFDLMFECGLCHIINKIGDEVEDGIFLPASRFTSMNLKCKNCGIETKVYFDELS